MGGDDLAGRVPHRDADEAVQSLPALYGPVGQRPADDTAWPAKDLRDGDWLGIAGSPHVELQLRADGSDVDARVKEYPPAESRHVDALLGDNQLHHRRADTAATLRRCQPGRQPGGYREPSSRGDGRPQGPSRILHPLSSVNLARSANLVSVHQDLHHVTFERDDALLHGPKEFVALPR